MRRALLVAALALLVAPAAAHAGPKNIQATDLRVNYLTDPVGIDDTTPSLSWRSTPGSATRHSAPTRCA